MMFGSFVCLFGGVWVWFVFLCFFWGGRGRGVTSDSKILNGDHLKILNIQFVIFFTVVLEACTTTSLGCQTKEFF